MKQKITFILTVLIAVLSTWFLTSSYYENQEIPLLTLKSSTNSQDLFEWTSFTCKPYLKNGSCGKVTEADFNNVITVMENQCNARVQEAVDTISEAGYRAIDNAFNSQPSSGSRYINTNCRTDYFTGNMVCNSIGN